jgi:hypothetical protein
MRGYISPKSFCSAVQFRGPHGPAPGEGDRQAQVIDHRSRPSLGSNNQRYLTTNFPFTRNGSTLSSVDSTNGEKAKDRMERNDTTQYGKLDLGKDKPPLNIRMVPPGGQCCLVYFSAWRPLEVVVGRGYTDMVFQQQVPAQLSAGHTLHPAAGSLA